MKTDPRRVARTQQSTVSQISQHLLHGPGARGLSRFFKRRTRRLTDAFQSILRECVYVCAFSWLRGENGESLTYQRMPQPLTGGLVGAREVALTAQVAGVPPRLAENGGSVWIGGGRDLRHCRLDRERFRLILDQNGDAFYIRKSVTAVFILAWKPGPFSNIQIYLLTRYQVFTENLFFPPEIEYLRGGIRSSFFTALKCNNALVVALF